MRTTSLILSFMLVSAIFIVGTPFTITSSEPTPLDTEQISFTNVTYDAGLAGVGGNFIAWGDYDNDGDQDLLVNGGRLLRNNGAPSWDFTDVSSQAGISGGSYGTWADWNNDGYLDLYTAGSDKLYRNNGPPGWDFTDVTAQSGIPQETYSTGVGWGDYDNDGFVDLYKLRGENYDEGIYYPDRLYHNNGNGTFTDVTEEAGVSEEADPKYGRGCAWADYNDDGWLDMYISNYRQQFNYLYENQGDGTFIDVALDKGVADGPPYGEGGNIDPYNRAGHGVGSVWGDYDNDGYLDLWVTNLNHKDARTSDDSLLYHNDGPPDYTFTNMRDVSGIHIKPYVAPNEGDELFVGCAWGDYDNDGDLDLYLPQIYDNSYAYSFLYMNNGDGTFTDVTLEAGVRVWDTYAGSWCDYDNDGDLDLITSGRDSGGNADPHFVHLYRNEGNSNNWLKLDIRGNGRETNTAGIGARVKITTDSGDSQIQEVEGGMGCHGHQNSMIIDFGLGDYSGTLDVEVRWTNGTVQVVEGVGINQVVTITEAVPDLEVVNFSVSDENPVQGEIVQLNATIMNIGNISTRYAFTRFYLGHPSENVLIGGPTFIKNIFQGDTVYVQISWDTTSYLGSNTIYAAVEDASPEEDVLDNNLKETQLYIRSENQPPTASLDISPGNPEAGEEVTLDGSYSSDDSHVAEYLFDFGDGKNSGWTSDSIVTHTYSLSGTYFVSLRVNDDDDTESENVDEQELRVRGPPIAKLTASPTFADVGEEVTFNGSATSDDGKIVKYFFDYGDGYDSGPISASVSTHMYGVAGEYTASLSVKDDDGLYSSNVAEVTITVTVPTNIKPVAYIQDITPNPASLEKEVSFDGYGLDEDGEVVGYLWTSSLDGELSTSQSFSTSSLSLGDHTISFKVQDDEGDWSSEVTESLTIKSFNVIPTISLLTLSDYQQVSGVITISGTAFDDDGDIVRVDISIDGSSWIPVDGTTAWSYQLDTTTLVEGEHTISVMAFDGEDYSEVESITIVVKQKGGTTTKSELSPALIFGIALAIGLIVFSIVTGVVVTKKKKEDIQPPPVAPQQMQPGQSSGTRWNW